MFRRQRQPQPPPAQPQPPARVRPLAQPPAAPPATLHPSQTRVIDWQQEAEAEARQLPAVSRGPAYVPAASEIIRLPEVHLASPDANLTADITPPAIVESKTLGGHQDRARAWIKYAMPLSLSTGGVMVIAAVALERVPLLSFWTLLIFGLTFIVTYGLLLRQYWRHTPEGVALENVGELWGYYKREQAHRHEIEREIVQAQMDANRRRLGGGQ
jgi:hypothetical protein